MVRNRQSVWTEVVTSSHTVTLLTRPGCHLCDDARAVIAAVCAELDVAWEERDISADPDELERYRDSVPVTLVDGAEHDFWRVSAPRLRRALTT
jgi:glutaredoxin